MLIQDLTADERIEISLGAQEIEFWASLPREDAGIVRRGYLERFLVRWAWCSIELAGWALLIWLVRIAWHLVVGAI
jgi:hypothetical protein